MRPQIAISSAVALALACGVSGAADEKQAAQDLEQLLGSVKRVLPAGWTADIVLTDPVVPARRGSNPSLVIKSSHTLRVKHFYPSMAASPTDTSQESVALYYISVPYMSAQTYSLTREENQVLRRRRVQFQHEHLKNIPCAPQKRPEPFPPSEFTPETEMQTKLVRQYALLWLQTQPRPLPTHHADKLSFRIHRASRVKIQDSQKDREFREICVATQKIIVPYEREP